MLFSSEDYSGIENKYMLVAGDSKKRAVKDVFRTKVKRKTLEVFYQEEYQNACTCSYYRDNNYHNKRGYTIKL